ncbi:tRNA(Ile)(2)-agmatinylcytidine synthase [Ferroplasma sp.]|uniref:tRNA(Ile)(2)-agmatinylcytidine synthase n=1 Tax=Ferroplasma sp. TaxID=2591003 RepID=UPI00307DC6ED
MYVAIDDTDSQDRMCTTYTIFDIISRGKYDIIGDPELVRLNPNISYKTRGNGALNINLGKGNGKRSITGKISGKYIYSYEKLREEPDQNELMDFISSIVEELYVKDSEKTNPGIVISGDRFEKTLYSKALQEDISINFIEKYLAEKAIYKKIKTGHGIIGSSASLAWPGQKYTYELLDYRYPHYGAISHDEKIMISLIPEEYQTTFNNVDLENNYPAIFPKPKTPVIFGVRGVDKNDLISIYGKIQEKHKIDDQGYIIFKTNQGTDDHILIEPDYLSNMGSYSATGIISGNPYTIEGGHSFVEMKYKNYKIKLAAFEPTKEFRKVLNSLIPGDIVNAYGSYMNGAIKLEKIKIIKKAKLYRKEAPVCPDCHVKTKSKGFMDYRCPVCKKRYKNAAFYEVDRNIEEKFYEVPVIARRHLSMPVKLAPYFYSMECV